MDYSGFQASRHNMYSNHFKVWVEFPASEFFTNPSVEHRVKDVSCLAYIEEFMAAILIPAINLSI
jgi:hypothetical protein